MTPTLPPLPVGALSFLLVAVGLAGQARADDWPHWHGPQRDSVWRETGVLSALPPGGPPVRWRTPVAAGYSSPVVADGRVFLLDRPRSQTRGNTGGALKRMAEPGVERVLCLDERTGRILWTHEYDCPYDLSYPSGPRSAPEVDGNRVYTLGAEGHLYCLEAATGRVLWSRHYPRDFAARTPL
jgi:outer membrane protein assembly factor BamB